MGRPRGGPGMNERLRAYRELSKRPELTRVGIAMRMRVSPRAVQEYARRVRQEDGISSPRRSAAQLLPQVFAYLQQPGREASAYEVARELMLGATATDAVRGALNLLIAEGLAEEVAAVRDPDRDPRPVRRYRLRADDKATLESLGEEAAA